MGKIFSPGKLLLTSEYVVLDGALALAVPTRLGQEFFFEEYFDKKSLVAWEACHQGKIWLKILIDYKNWSIIETNILSSAEFILKVLKNIQTLSKTKFLGDESYHLKTNLQFPSDFGLGSSSTLMNNLAEWATIDPFLLNEVMLGGSGYDIAVAKEKSSILYQLNGKDRIIEKIHFKPPFSEEIIFIHLNQKQDTREGISMYTSKTLQNQLMDEFSEITQKIVNTTDLSEFSSLMQKHEDLLAGFLKITTVKERLFKDCPVFVKSLGAWGGDFVMSRKFENYSEYFSARGFTSVFDWKDLII